MKKANFNFSEIAENIRNLNPKEYYAWPASVQIGVGTIVLGLVAVLGTVFDLYPLTEELQASVQKEANLKEEFIDKKTRAVNLPLYKEQLQEVIKDSDALLRQLPDRSQMEKLLIDVNQSAIGRGLQVELFKPGVEKINEYYAELPIELKMTGSYDAIGNFASDTSQLSRVVLFTDMDISTKNGSVMLTATAKTFRYLDQAELDAQAKKKAEARKKKAAAAAGSEPAKTSGHGG